MRMRTLCLHPTQRETSGSCFCRRAHTWKVNSSWLSKCRKNWNGRSLSGLLGHCWVSVLLQTPLLYLTDQCLAGFIQRALCCFLHIPKSLCTLSSGWWWMWSSIVYRNPLWVLYAVLRLIHTCSETFRCQCQGPSHTKYRIPTLN